MSIYYYPVPTTVRALFSGAFSAPAGFFLRRYVHRSKWLVVVVVVVLVEEKPPLLFVGIHTSTIRGIVVETAPRFGRLVQ